MCVLDMKLSPCNHHFNTVYPSKENTVCSKPVEDVKMSCIIQNILVVWLSLLMHVFIRKAHCNIGIHHKNK